MHMAAPYAPPPPRFNAQASWQDSLKTMMMMSAEMAYACPQCKSIQPPLLGSLHASRSLLAASSYAPKKADPASMSTRSDMHACTHHKHHTDIARRWRRGRLEGTPATPVLRVLP